ncbi:ABC transporter permease [Chitinophaga qingshengii]|uniref:ABC transporter permease n=1 Tax=Chitinophaga qingshengii TaxID=1569794 RepID=A0ABR7TQ79_9BACT|nr:ABC transporter permease [Chitinophaga qingshengii]MBC9931676.1 ABC transporter permease [Chitinophaga qingshengii]
MMIKNYLLVAWRNLDKHRFFSTVNITGLSIGLAFVLLIGAYAWGEWQVNALFKDNDRIMLLRSKWSNPEMGFEGTTIGPLAKALQDNYPSLVSSIYRHDAITSIVSIGDKHFREQLQPGDSTFLQVFSFPLLYGDARTALQQPNAVVLTANKARQFFGKTDVVGNTLSIQSFDGKKQDFEITAVMQDPPFNTVSGYTRTSKNEIFLAPGSIAFFGRQSLLDSWQSVYTVGYVVVKPGVTTAQLQQAAATLLKTHTPASVYQHLTVAPIPLDQYYLQMNNGIARKMMLVLLLVAGFILMMAVINFVNISMGNSLTRIKEIGVRKVMGGRKHQLVLQFITESVLVAAFSFMVALLFFVVLRPLFGQVLEKDIPGLNSFPVWFACLPVPVILFTGLVAGIYPAFVLSAQPSVTALKGKLQQVKEKVMLRRGLIVVQFVTAIIVFTGAVVINQQLSYFFNKNLGYDKDHVMSVPVPRDWTATGVRHLESVRNEFAGMGEVTAVSYSYEIPNGNNSGSNMMYRPPMDSSQAITAVNLVTDEQFAAAYGIKMEAGSFFYKNSSSNEDSSRIVLNASAAKALGWKSAQEAMGQPVKLYNYPKVLYVAGVTRDFHFSSLHTPIAPMYITHAHVVPLFRYLSFRLKPGNPSAAIAAIQKKWQALFPDAPFEYRFMDDTIAALYAQEQQMKKAAHWATIVSLLIVLLGVLGIITLSMARRNKEMGIRKILGASPWQITCLFAQEFSGVILIANLVAWPVAWLILQHWLSGYAYRINMGLEPFIVVALSLLLLVCIIVLGMTRKLAVTAPVKSLRTE